MLNSKGQCCGRKPIVYKLDGYRFCPRCDRQYEIGTDAQVANWAWKADESGAFVLTDLGKTSQIPTRAPTDE